jgi:hypothetical protein
MRKSRFSEEQIIAILKEQEAAAAEGLDVGVCQTTLLRSSLASGWADFGGPATPARNRSLRLRGGSRIEPSDLGTRARSVLSGALPIASRGGTLHGTTARQRC